MSRYHAYYTRSVWFLLLLAVSTLGGLQLSRWLATQRAVAEAQQHGPIHLPKTPAPSVTTMWIELFNAAQHEIWLSAGRLESETILRALDAAAKRGVLVHITLSPAQNPSSESGTRAWLRENTMIRDVHIGSQRFDGAACVVDDDHAVVTGQGLLPNSASAEDAGLFFYTRGPVVALPLRDRLKEKHAAALASSPSP